MNTSNISQYSSKSQQGQPNPASKNSTFSQSVLSIPKSDLNNPQKKVVELTMLNQLTFDQFIYTDMSLFSASVTSVAKKLLSAEVK